MYAFCAMFILPIAFNFASLLNANHYWQTAKKDDRLVKMLLMLALQVPGLDSRIFSLHMVISVLKGLKPRRIRQGPPILIKESTPNFYKLCCFTAVISSKFRGWEYGGRSSVGVYRL